jgi:hypothetical protein
LGKLTVTAVRTEQLGGWRGRLMMKHDPEMWLPVFQKRFCA